MHTCCSVIDLARAWQGVNKVGDKIGESKCALVYGQMNEPPGARARVALTGMLSKAAFKEGHLTKKADCT